MATTTITLTHERASNLDVPSNARLPQTVSRLINFLQGGVAGNFNITTVDLGQTQATGTVTCSGVGGSVRAKGDVTYSSAGGTTTVTINGVAFSQTTGNDAARGAALVAAVNASTNPLIDGILTAIDNLDGTVDLEADTKGAAGNAIMLAVTGTGLTRSGATFAGGVDCMSVTVGGVQVKLGEEGASNTLTAAAMAAAINADATASKLVTATSALGVVTITAKAAGGSGNMGLSSVATSGTATASGATLTGGTSTTHTR